MAKYLVEDTSLAAVADAIREKTAGGADLTFPDGFVTAISSIEQGGGDLDGFIEGTMTELTSGAGTVRDYAAYQNTAITSADFPNASSIGAYVFYQCSSLTTANFPNATSLRMYAFGYCSALTTANFPNASSIEGNTFYSCKALTTANFPNVTSIGAGAFADCQRLTTVDLPKLTSVPTTAFSHDYSLTAVILRSETLCTLAGTNAFYYCHHFHGTVHSTYNPDGLKDGYIYVPSALVDGYKAATNWSTFASQFRALEDYTVDGTITGALDETKI